MNWEDPIVAEVRRTRENVSAKFDFDVSAIFADLRARQTSAGNRLVRAKRAREAHAIGALVFSFYGGSLIFRCAGSVHGFCFREELDPCR